VRLAAFETERGEDWRRLQDALARAGGRPERLGPDGVRELGALYRGAAADLAYARRRYPGDPVVARLEALVVAGRGAVYGQTSRGGSVREFLVRGYWRRLAERPVLILVAWLLLLAPAAAGALWAAGDPGAALGLVPGELQAAADPPAEGRDFDAATASAFSAQVMVNNIQVTLAAFAGGLAVIGHNWSPFLGFRGGDDVRATGRALRRAGVDAELHVAEAMPHGGFFGAPEDAEMGVELRRFLAKHL